MIPRSTKPLTRRQLAILSYIHRHIRYEGYPPTLRELGVAFGIKSTNGVNDHLLALEHKGMIVRRPRASRTLKLTSHGLEAVA
jgi:repressor LexA